MNVTTLLVTEMVVIDLSFSGWRPFSLLLGVGLVLRTRRLNRGQQRLEADRTVVAGAVDKERRGIGHAAANPAGEIGMHPAGVDLAHQFVVVAIGVQPDLGAIQEQFGIAEMPLALEQIVVHIPELSLYTSRFRGLRRVLSLRVRLAQGKVPKDDTQLGGHDLQNRLDDPLSV